MPYTMLVSSSYKVRLRREAGFRTSMYTAEPYNDHSGSLPFE